MGIVQKPMGSRRLGICSQINIPFITTIAVLFVLWSLLSLDIDSLGSEETNSDVQIASQNPEKISTQRPEDIPTIEAEPARTLTQSLYAEPSPEPTTSKTIPAIPSEPRPISTRPLILYAYADSEGGSSLTNLKFFIEHGLHDAADFIFILNGETDVESIIPIEDNTWVVERPNDCYDLGAFAEVLTTDDLYKGYTKFIMMNASIRGPFLPYWSSDCWSDLYLSKITDEVKLVGMTANCWPSFHIQSMIWATDIIGLTTLLYPPTSALTYLTKHPILVPAPKNKQQNPPVLTTSTSTSHSTAPIPAPQLPGINSCFHTWDSAVLAEISSTALIKAAGYKVDAMMAAFHGISAYEKGESCEANRDVLWEGEYFGGNVHPFETVFMKSNRDVDPQGLERHGAWMKGRGYRSYDYCKV